MRAEQIARALGKARRGTDGWWSCLCPNHKDKNPSFSIKDNERGGPPGVKCHAECGDTKVLHEALKERGLWCDDWDRRKREIRPDWVYLDERGRPYLGVCRYKKKDGGKGYTQNHWDDKKREWVSGKPDGPKIPYRLQEFIDAPAVFVVEGEKCADALRALGLPATTSSEGATKWTPDLNKWFEGKSVYLIADNDEPGRRHIAIVGGELSEVANCVRLVRMPCLAEGEDVADWIEAGGTASELLELVERSVPVGGLAFFEALDTDPELKAAVEFLIGSPPNSPEADIAAGLVMTRLADVQIKQVEWVWPGRVARGKITADAGHPGVGKSVLGCDVAARITKGMDWPCDEGRAPEGSVIILTTEDDVADTIKPRILAAGGDVNKVYVVQGVIKEDGRHKTFSLANDLALLEEAVQEIGDVVMVKIDPVNAYLGQSSKNFDSYRDSDIRAVFEPIQEMAQRLNIAVWATTHFNKSGGSKAITRFLGSIGMVGLSRAAYAVVEDEDEEAEPGRVLFLPVKINLAKNKGGLAFRLIERPTGDDVVPFCVGIEWEDEAVSITADEALAPKKQMKENDGRKSKDAETIKDMLAYWLKDGPVSVKEIEQLLETNGFDPKSKSVRTAREKLGVLSRQQRGGVGEPWELYLPGQCEMEV